jgi:hypothetical protein
VGRERREKHGILVNLIQQLVVAVADKDVHYICCWL